MLQVKNITVTLASGFQKKMPQVVAFNIITTADDIYDFKNFTAEESPNWIR